MSSSSKPHSLSSTFCSGLNISAFIRYEIHDAGLLNLKIAFECLLEVGYLAHGSGDNKPELFACHHRYVVIEETPNCLEAWVRDLRS